MRLHRYGSVMLALLLPAAAQAQAYQCAIPTAPISVPQVEQDGPTRQMDVTGYTLALSWSPEFCRFREDSARHTRQCSGEAGRFGLIVHGLWPEGRNSWPQYCPVKRELSAEDIRANLCISPSAEMLVHEWQKHGSCMGVRPETYFAVTRILWNSLRIPDLDRLSRRDGLTAGDLREALAEANRYWEPEMIGIDLNQRGWLEEMRLCYAADFKPTRCTRQQFGVDDATEMSIWRGL